MLIDDELFNLIPVSALLQMQGIVSVQFEDGNKALQCFQRRLLQTCCSRMFRIVLTDIYMPRLDGFQTAELLRSTQ